MLTLISMLMITCFLGFTILYKCKFAYNEESFFDKDTAKSLRGFWCLVIMLVHVPLAYQNTIQDMIGSFAYIGVTYFFMTSSFGLISKASNGKVGFISFWKSRVFKLLIPCLVTNLVYLLVDCILYSRIVLSKLIYINRWVLCLLICYLIFNISYFLFDKRARNLVLILMTVVFSIFSYMFWKSMWYVEVLGFVYGVSLSLLKSKFLKSIRRRYVVKTIILLCCALLLGGLYIKYKQVDFWGDYLIRIGLSFAIILFMLSLIARFKIGNKISAFFGNISFEIYLVHGAIYSLIMAVFPKMNSGIFILVSMLGTIAISYVINKADMKICQTIDRLLVRKKI